MADVDDLTRARAEERAHLASVLRRVSAGRREYASTAQMDYVRRWLDHEADLFEAAALIVEGDLKPLYGLLPSWRWDDEMRAAGAGVEAGRVGEQQ